MLNSTWPKTNVVSHSPRSRISRMSYYVVIFTLYSMSSRRLHCRRCLFLAIERMQTWNSYRNKNLDSTKNSSGAHWTRDARNKMWMKRKTKPFDAQRQFRLNEVNTEAENLWHFLITKTCQMKNDDKLENYYPFDCRFVHHLFDREHYSGLKSELNRFGRISFFFFFVFGNAQIDRCVIHAC